MVQPNRKGLVDYLAKQGIDAFRIPEANVDETGFDYYQVDDAGRPVRTGTNRLVRERREWPSPEVYQTVMLLLAGGEVGQKTEFTAEEVQAAGEKQLAAPKPKPKAKATPKTAVVENPVMIVAQDA